MRNRDRAVGGSDETLLAARRRRNLRQLLLRSLRVVNELTLEELESRGFTDIPLAHASLLAHIDVNGNTITEVAERMHVTKQALGRFAADLEDLGYLTRREDENDARARILCFTAKGRRLLEATTDAVDTIEKRLAKEVGERRVSELRRTLRSLADGPLGGEGEI